MFCMFPDSKSELKKWATTGQSFIRKEITSYRIGTLVQLVPTFEYILQVEIYICTLNSHNSKLSSICNMYHLKK